MSLATRITALASRIGLEVKTKIDASHPGVARAWVCFGYVGSQIEIRAAHNVASVTRTAAGRYRVIFANAMPDDIDRALRAGFADYWTKPLDLHRFMRSLDSIFGTA